MKQRIDVYMAANGLADSREKAAEVNGEIRDDVLARVSAVE